MGTLVISLGGLHTIHTATLDYCAEIKLIIIKQTCGEEAENVNSRPTGWNDISFYIELTEFEL